MPCTTWLTDSEVREFASVPDDKELNETLQQLRSVTGENWLVGKRKVSVQHDSILKRVFCKQPPPITTHTLYNDCHGEYQIINLAGPEGGTVFHHWPNEREGIINYILGFIGGHQRALATEKRDG